MKSLILPIVLLLLGAGGGVGAGLALLPEKEEVLVDDPCGASSTEANAGQEAQSRPVDLGSREYAKMNNQFVVPIVTDNRMTSLIVMSLSIEVETGGKDAVFAHEPRLRDAFLQVMFDHANIGGFSGAFTSTSNMRILREALQTAADEVMEGHISDVLIVEIVRQDVTN